MFDLAAPLHPVCIRTLRAASTSDRRLADTARRTSRLSRTLRMPARAGRLIRLAAVAYARADELAAQARG